MHGPAPAPPPHRPPARGTVVLLRVVFVAATVLSLGFLAWAALLRAAIVQRRPLGWWLFAADLVAVIGVSLWSYGYPETDWRTDVAVAVILLQLAGAVAYYLVVDIRAVRTAEQKAAGWAPGGGGFGPAMYPAGVPAPGHAPAGYGSPPPTAPVPPHAQETHPAYPPPYAPAPQPYRPPSPPQPAPPPQRIDRVRAELDELSDYLRREEGR
jgi:drug/metabolite transporter (DMT)-like permease